MRITTKQGLCAEITEIAAREDTTENRRDLWAAVSRARWYHVDPREIQRACDEGRARRSGVSCGS